MTTIARGVDEHVDPAQEAGGGDDRCAVPAWFGGDGHGR